MVLIFSYCNFFAVLPQSLILQKLKYNRPQPATALHLQPLLRPSQMM